MKTYLWVYRPLDVGCWILYGSFLSDNSAIIMFKNCKHYRRLTAEDLIEGVTI